LEFLHELFVIYLPLTTTMLTWAYKNSQHHRCRYCPL